MLGTTDLDKCPEPFRSTMRKARVFLLTKMPYLAPVVLRLPVYYTDSKRIPTACINKRGVIAINVPWASKLSAREMEGLLFHEAAHWMWVHFARCNGRDPQRWNVAGDLVINETARRAGLKMPADSLFFERFGPAIGAAFAGEVPTVEVVYSLLPEGTGIGNPCGSGAGNPTEGEGEIPGELEPAGGADSAREAADMASDAIAKGLRKAGAGSAECDIWANSTARRPTVDPLAQIRAMTGRALAAAKGRLVQPVWTRANRRGYDYLPGRQTHTPDITVIVDASGSMCNEFDGNHVLSQVWNVLNKLGSCRVIVNDTVVSFDARVRSIAEFRKAMRGGGGTELTPAFEAAFGEGSAAPVIVLTDGYLPCPNHPAVSRALWVVTRGEGVQDWMPRNTVILNAGSDGGA